LEIDANFKFDGSVGHHEKWIVVTTDWVPPQQTTLRLAVNIPEAITIQPELVLWRVDNAAVKLELREIRPGKELEVTVTPTTTSQPESATVLIRTDYPPPNPTTHFPYARVK
jgi:hypothetical protein